MLIFHETQLETLHLPVLRYISRTGRLDLKYKPCLGDTNVFILLEGCL